MRACSLAPSPSQVQLFKDSKFPKPLRALPFSEIKTGAEIVYLAPYTDESDCLVYDYWYGKIGLMTKSSAHWVNFLDLEDGEKICEEKHPFKLADYYDTWMLVERA